MAPSSHLQDDYRPLGEAPYHVPSGKHMQQRMFVRVSEESGFSEQANARIAFTTARTAVVCMVCWGGCVGVRSCLFIVVHTCVCAREIARICVHVPRHDPQAGVRVYDGFETLVKSWCRCQQATWAGR